jgi:transcription initiation factor IIE alpha subunit
MPRAKKAPSPIAPDLAVTVAPVIAKAPRTKSATVLACLEREQGATLVELVAATGWQPHTTRAMLTGLRKKGHAIKRRKRDDVSCYHLPVAGA